MKNRQLLKIHGLSAVCSLIMMLASCSSEEIVPNGTGTDADGDKNLTTFVAVGPEQTRTSMDYTGGDAPFYWEEGDKIYVKDDDGAWKASNAVDAAHAHSASFKFKVSGKFNNSSTYKVFYPGTNGTNDQVTIPATQTQTAPNTTLHFGEAGDCGTGDATWKNSAKGFAFTLDHQAAILVFQPYTNNTILRDCYLTKVEVTSNNDITDTYTLDPVTGKLTGTGNGKQITLHTRGSGIYGYGFPLTNTSASLATNGAYMVIRPGIHILKVRYWVRSNIDNIEGTITRYLSSFNYAANTYYDMTANLDVKDYDGYHYYMWDAQNNFWHQHEWDTSDPWQPAQNFLPANPNYPQPGDALNRYFGTSFSGTGVRSDATTPLFQTLPNANEMVWYVVKGDPRWDADELWTTMGHLYKGGMWFLKKAKIASKNSTTTAAMATADPDGIDRCVTFISSNPTGQIFNNSLKPGIPSATDINDYFYLPSLGITSNGSMSNIGVSGGYWSSSASPQVPVYAYGINFNDTEIWVSSNCFRGEGFVARPFE